MLLRGHEVEVIGVDGEHVITPKRDGGEADLWILEDDRGERFPRCHPRLVQTRSSRLKLSECNENDVNRAKSYYGAGARLQIFEPVMSNGPWKLLASATEIRYRRGRTGLWRHPFESKVRIYVSTKPLTYKLVMPDGCILNDHGFIEP